MAGFAWPAVVVDVGSGYTKMGYAGNIEPQLVVPTCVANRAGTGRGVHISHGQGTGIMDADFYIGEEAYQKKDSPNYLLSYPVSRGRIDNWDDMERFMQQAIFRNLRCVPEDHNFLLTETAFNTPQNRELTAEIMFETFNVRGLHIAVQAVLALYAQWVNDVKVENPGASPDLTGLVVDSGDGLTHVIPVADGFVVSSCIQEIPLAGRHVTQFVSDMLTDRGEPVPPEQRMEAARQIKEQHAYICKDVVEEYQKFDRDPRKFKTYHGVTHRNKEDWAIQIGYERFLAPEIFFNPEIFVDNVTTPLPEVVDSCIMQCPIDYRRRLYSNIVLSGGSTTFQNFKERLQHDLQRVVDARLRETEIASGNAPKPIPVQVQGGRQRKQQRYAAWLGGSLVAQEPHFLPHFKTKQEYEEVGPSCMRGSPVLLG
mmetsp:Transcript_68304/g.172160  ORF Transcript_68304/g.172160 Transcript_68304/m.172160 type:complete len:426 (+) Transcript_68304:98-1375(+)